MFQTAEHVMTCQGYVCQLWCVVIRDHNSLRAPFWPWDLQMLSYHMVPGYWPCLVQWFLISVFQTPRGGMLYFTLDMKHLFPSNNSGFCLQPPLNHISYQRNIFKETLTKITKHWINKKIDTLIWISCRYPCVMNFLQFEYNTRTLINTQIRLILRSKVFECQCM